MESNKVGENRVRDSQGNEGDLEDLIGVDTNILTYALDPSFPEHSQAKKAILSSEKWAVNATVIHETYHTLVFRRKIQPADARLKLGEFLRDERTIFLNLTKSVSLFGLGLACKMNLGGRDSLIIGSYLQNKIPEMYSHDEELVRLGTAGMKGRRIRINDPLR